MFVFCFALGIKWYLFIAAIVAVAVNILHGLFGPIATFHRYSHFPNLILNRLIRLEIDCTLHLFKSSCVTSLSVILVSHNFSNMVNTISLQCNFNLLSHKQITFIYFSSCYAA